MEQLIIKGQKQIKGEIKINGAKNCALKILAASLLTSEPVQIDNLPQIEDVFRLNEILTDLGTIIKKSSFNSIRVHTPRIKKKILNKKIVPKLRSSVVLLGPLLARNKEVILPHPGGCAIGKRPINIFIESLKAFNVKVNLNSKKNYYHFKTTGLVGTRYVFSKISVTATETLILAAVLAKGKTELINAACEPEIAELANFLNKCGANIKGAGTSFIEIIGVSQISGGKINIMPDRIEAFSFVALGIANNSNLLIKNCEPKHLDVPLKILKTIGANIIIGKDYIITKKGRPLNAIDISTHEYPGFPTDCQAPLTVLLTQARGISTINETIFEDRFIYTDLLKRMNAKINMINSQKINIFGPTQLVGKQVESPDLRAGIAMIIAALIARGTTTINNIYQIDRGYENIDTRLRSIGADIKRIKI